MNDRNQAILWANSIMDSADAYYILDTETTGINNPEIIELAVIDLNGNEIINQRFCPRTDVTTGASEIHGLTNASLAEEPEFSIITDCLNHVIFNRKLLIYNIEFDRTALAFTFGLFGYAHPNFVGECVMDKYSHFCGEWNDYHGSYRWQKLPGGDHSAVGDCKATLELIKGMANSPPSLGLMPLKSPAA